ncbi:MAG: hypothetical protein ACUVQV_06065 [Dissulfurimicrobium sp.]
MSPLAESKGFELIISAQPACLSMVAGKHAIDCLAEISASNPVSG